VIRFVRLALLSVVIFACSFSAAQAGTIVADSGFRPDPNGFSFPNYGDDSDYENLDENEMQRLFGSAVCLTGRGAKCVLTSAARTWMDDMNDAMGGGHCYGFSVLSNLIYKNQIRQFGYPSIEAFGGGPFSYDLSIENNRVLQGAIARAFVTQAFPRVREKGVYGAPTDILETLRKSLNPVERESYQLVIFKRGFEGGHAITPYAVEDMGGGIFHVHVYDNNWPGDASRRLIVDANQNTWSYYASQNPDRPQALYEGDAKTGTLSLRSTRSSLGLQECPFCSGRQGGKSKFNQVTITGGSLETARLLFTDRKGRKTGYVGGRFVNRIPGAQIIHRSSNAEDTLEPIYLLPKKTWFKVRVSGRGLTTRVRQSLSIVGPTFDATVNDILIKPGQVAHATLAPKRKRLSFGATTLDDFPEIDFGAQAKKASYRIGFMVGKYPRGTKLVFTKKPRYGLLRVAAAKKKPRLFGVEIRRFMTSGETTFSRAYHLRGKEQAYLAYGPLARPNGLARIVVANPRTDKVRVLKVTEDK